MSLYFTIILLVYTSFDNVMIGGQLVVKTKNGDVFVDRGNNPAPTGFTLEDIVEFFNPLIDDVEQSEEGLQQIDIDSYPNKILCLQEMKAIQVSQAFPSPIPEDPEYENHGFRKIGEECDPKKEAEFYAALQNITHLKTADFPEFKENVQLSLPYRWYVQKWSAEWRKWAMNPSTSKKICNPRWFLECLKASDVDKYYCNCMQSGLHKLGIELDSEYSDHTICDETGSCKKKTHVRSYHCVSTVSERIVKNKDDDDDDRGFDDGAKIDLKACELNLPIFGICALNCQHGSECYTPMEMGLNIRKDIRQKFKMKRICCNQKTKCKEIFEPISGQSKIFENCLLVWLSLILWVIINV